MKIKTFNNASKQKTTKHVFSIAKGYFINYRTQIKVE